MPIDRATARSPARPRPGTKRGATWTGTTAWSGASVRRRRRLCSWWRWCLVFRELHLQAALRHYEFIHRKVFRFLMDFQLEAILQQRLQHRLKLSGTLWRLRLNVVSFGLRPARTADDLRCRNGITAPDKHLQGKAGRCK